MHFPPKKKFLKKNFYLKLNTKMEHYMWQSTETKSGANSAKTKSPGHADSERRWLISILESGILSAGSYTSGYKLSGNEYF